ncbi:MAG: HupE/UreJ family protein [Sandaracinaceae bacterium]
MRRVAALALLLALLAPERAAAHGFAPGVLALSEERPGRFRLSWTQPIDTRRQTEAHVRPVFPSSCRRDGAHLECGERGLTGTLAFVDIPTPATRVVISIRHLDGTRDEAVVTGESPEMELSAHPGGSFVAWIRIGVEHVVTGLDHVAFVLGLLLVAWAGASQARLRRVLLAVTAFTVAHSITLALSALDLVRVASRPVEACIAASVVLVAREALHEGETLTRRLPWLVASGFGLLHGLGFAGALRDQGLPEGSLRSALVGFNVGVELGQLAVVALALGAAWVVSRRASTRLPKWAVCYALGALGAWWTIDRAVDIVL